MAKVTLNDLSKALGLNEKEPNKDFHYYGTIVDSNPSDNTYQVSINRDTNISVEAARLVGAARGDTVMVTVMANGYATVTGRLGGDLDATEAQRAADDAADVASGAMGTAQTAMTNASEANRIANNAKTLAENAEAEAGRATTAANNAVAEAGRAHTAAEQAASDASSAASSALAAATSAQNAANDASNAATSAATANDAAVSAQTSADNALSAAESATTSANSALIQLSTVESVVGTLEWISKHGKYERTDNTSVLDGKLYFAKVGDSYVVQTLAEDAAPQALGLYELTSVDEAVTNYIASHLALDGEGLSIVKDDRSGRALFSTGGVTIFNASGDPVAFYGEKTVLGNKDGVHIEIDPTIPQLGFYTGNSSTTDPVAYISNDQLWIPRAVVVDSMQVGNNSEGGAWQWSIDKTTRNLRLVWIGGQ